MRSKTILTNPYDPDPRVRLQALLLIGMACRVHLLAWDVKAARPVFLPGELKGSSNLDGSVSAAVAGVRD
jgi:hypothetical protein